MKRILIVLTAVVLLMSLYIPKMKAEESGNDVQPAVAAEKSMTASLSDTGTAAERTAGKTVTLKRGKTLKLWVYPFASTTQFYKDCGKDYPVKAIHFSGTSGKIKAKVTGGSSWLKAKKTSSGWKFYVTGRNLTLKDKKGTILIADGKGAFATIFVTRGGTVQYSKIYSKGSSIYASIKPQMSQSAADLYVYRWIFDKSGKVVSKKKLRVLGTDFRDTVKGAHLKYTYVYTVGYYADPTGIGMQTGAAAIWLSDPMSNTGKVKKATRPKDCITASWLYGIVH